MNKGIYVYTLEAVDPHTVRIAFSIPEIYVNLKGRVEFRYTNGTSDDISTWESQLFAPPDELLATSKLEFEMSRLKPKSLYRIQVKLLLRDISMETTSEILMVKLPAEPELKLSEDVPVSTEY